jgi:hypothetical protein
MVVGGVAIDMDEGTTLGIDTGLHKPDDAVF